MFVESFIGWDWGCKTISSQSHTLISYIVHNTAGKDILLSICFCISHRTVSYRVLDTCTLRYVQLPSCDLSAQCVGALCVWECVCVCVGRVQSTESQAPIAGCHLTALCADISRVTLSLFLSTNVKRNDHQAVPCNLPMKLRHAWLYEVTSIISQIKKHEDRMMNIWFHLTYHTWQRK